MIARRAITAVRRAAWARAPQLASARALSDEPREAMEYDVVTVGAGPAGLAAAIRLKQLAMEKGEDLSVCVVEKGAEVGAHILSGNVFEPRALDELIPDWKERGAPVETAVDEDTFMLLSETSSLALPNFLLPSQLVSARHTHTNSRHCTPNSVRANLAPFAAQRGQLHH